MTATTFPMSIRIEASAREKLKQIAARQKRSAHALATEAINNLIAQEEQKHAWNQSCVNALQHYDETGLHATHAEVMAWMDSLGTANELPTPTCHK